MLIRSMTMGVAVFAGAALAGPSVSTWQVTGPDDTAAVAAAALSGWYAAADSYEDTVEIRDVNQALVRTITRAEITALLPWMTLDGSQDGPDALAFSDSGRLLFIAVHDANQAGDGLGSDAILRYDTQTNTLGVFARLEIQGTDAPWPHGSLAHFKGQLYVGLSGGVQVVRANMNDTTGVPLYSAAGAAGQRVNALAVDRVQNTLYAGWNGQVYRSPINGSSLTWTLVGAIPGLRALAWSDHFGGTSNAGLYAMDSTPPPSPVFRVWAIPPAMARGTQAFAPSLYLAGLDEWHDLCATADGKLLAGANEDAVLIADTSDTRLSYQSWLADEFAQTVNFARGLITTSPAGWVIDADVQVGGTRFHPATADGACWTILLLLMNDRLNADATAQAGVRQILQRYSGNMPDAIRPLRSADGLYWHWIDPATGNAKPGWGDGYAVMSTMKIVMAAARAAQHYPSDPLIRSYARDIICPVHNWDAYINPGRQLYLLGQPGGGPLTSTASSPFNEGVIFVEEAASYGGPTSQSAFTYWRNRSLLPAAAIVTGRTVTGGSFGSFQSAFVSLYELLTMSVYRADPQWQTQILNLRLSNAAWTDDNGPKYNTVFSAGTTAPQWGGYNADSLSNHPGNVATFTSLEAFAAGTGAGAASTPESVGAYEAYRNGARQTFLGGSSILYRRSDVDRNYQPDSAGLPDVALGALGLAELLQPGSVAAVLTGTYPSCSCVADVDDGSGTGTPDGGVTIDDLLYYLNIFDAGLPRADVDDGTFSGTPDGGVTIDDLLYYMFRFDAGC